MIRIQEHYFVSDQQTLLPFPPPLSITLNHQTMQLQSAYRVFCIIQRGAVTARAPVSRGMGLGHAGMCGRWGKTRGTAARARETWWEKQR